MTIMLSKESIYKANKDYDGFSLNQAGFRKQDYATLKSELKEETRSGGYVKSKKEENSVWSQQRRDIELYAKSPDLSVKDGT